MSRNTIPLEEIMKILDDGEWHGLNEFIPLSRAHVTPEHASRRYLYACRKGRTQRRGGNVELDQAIARGIQHCIEERLRSLARRGVLKIEGKDFLKRYKKS